MNKLFSCADEYLARSDWKDLALLKFCLCAIGVLLGLAVPKEKRRCAFFAAAGIFIATYIPLMSKFFSVAHDVCAADRCGE